MAAAKERIAQHLEKGHSFTQATVMEPVRDRHEQPGLDKEGPGKARAANASDCKSESAEWAGSHARSSSSLGRLELMRLSR